MRIPLIGEVALPRVVSGQRWGSTLRQNELMTSALTSMSAVLHNNPHTILSRAMQEMDSQALQWILDMIDWESVDGQTTAYHASEQRRGLAVQRSRSLTYSDNNAYRTIQTWTDYGFGRTVVITPKDAGDAATFAQFWKAGYNRHVLGDREVHKLSDRVLIDGEVFLAFFGSRATGRTRVRVVDPDEIVEYKTNPQDKYEVAWWKRAWVDQAGTSHQAWYPDWSADEEIRAKVRQDLGYGAKVATELAREEQHALMVEQNGGAPLGGVPDGTGTVILLMHVSREERGGVRGWPHLAVARDSAEEYRSWLHARHAVAQAVYLYVDKLKTRTGTRGMSMIQRALQSTLASASGAAYDQNPPAAPASTWVENEQLQRERMPLGTGGADAARDNSAFLGYYSAGAGVTPMHLGQGELVRMAVAEMMMQPILRQWMRYQTFWRSVWVDVADVVLTMAGSTTDHGVDVSMDTLVDASLEDVARALTALSDAAQKGTIPFDRAIPAALHMVKAMLEKLGFDDAEEILGDMQDAGEPAPAPPSEVTRALSYVRALERLAAREAAG